MYDYEEGLLKGLRISDIVATDRAAHISLEPGVDAAYVEAVLTVCNGADLAAKGDSVLANGAHLPLRRVDFNYGIG